MDEGHHVAAFDRSGDFVNLASTGNVVKRFDRRNLDKVGYHLLLRLVSVLIQQGAVYTSKIEGDAFTFERLVFSPDNNAFLVNTHQGQSFVLDASSGKVLRTLKIKNDHKCRLGAAFTPDSKCVLLGTEEGHVEAHRVAEGQDVRPPRRSTSLLIPLVRHLLPSGRAILPQSRRCSSIRATRSSPRPAPSSPSGNRARPRAKPRTPLVLFVPTNSFPYYTLALLFPFSMPQSDIKILVQSLSPFSRTSHPRHLSPISN